MIATTEDRKELLILLLLDHLRGIDAALNQHKTFPADVTYARNIAARAIAMGRRYEN